MKMTPLQIVKGKFEKKAKFVDALLGKLEKREGESKDAFRKRMMKVSSAKLLSLQARLEEKSTTKTK